MSEVNVELDALLSKIDVNVDIYKKEIEDSSSRSFDDTAYHNIVNGDNFMRVLPPWNEKGRFAKRVLRHYGIPVSLEPGEDGKIAVRTYLCLQNFGGTCPIDTVLKEYESKTERVGDFWASDYYYVNALIFDLKGNVMYDGKPKVVKITWGVYSWIRGQITNPKIGNILHPITGCDIQVTRTVVKGKTSYKCDRLKESRIATTDQEVVIILKNLVDLDKLFAGPANLADLLVEGANTLREYLDRVITIGEETKLPEDKKADPAPAAPVAAPASEAKTGFNRSTTPAPAATVAAPAPAAPVAAPAPAAPVAAPAPAAPVAAPAPAAPVAAPAPAAPVAAAAKPEGAKPCFGTYFKKFDPASDTGYDFKKCIPCKFETLCKNSSPKA